MKLSFVEKVKSADADSIVLVKFKHKSGLDLYAYLKVSRRAFEDLGRQYKSHSAIRFSEYGEIILFGKGEPSEETKKFIQSLKE